MTILHIPSSLSDFKKRELVCDEEIYKLQQHPNPPLDFFIQSQDEKDNPHPSNLTNLFPPSLKYLAPRESQDISTGVQQCLASPGANEMPSPSSDCVTQNFTSNKELFQDLYELTADEEMRKKENRGPKFNCQKELYLTRSAAVPDAYITTSVLPSFSKELNSMAYMSMKPSIIKTPMSKIQRSLKINTNLGSPAKDLLPSEPPSLYNSASSTQMTRNFIPPTPDSYGTGEIAGERWDGSVQLQPDAMETLKALSCGNDPMDDIPDDTLEQFLDLTPRALNVPEVQKSGSCKIQNASVAPSAMKKKCNDDFMKIEIPSPTRFFSTTWSPGTRHTWHFDLPATSAAEQFYTHLLTRDGTQNQVETPEAALNEIPTPDQPKIEKEQPRDKSHFAPICPINGRISQGKITGHKTSLSVGRCDKKITNYDRTNFWVAVQQSIVSKTSNLFAGRGEEEVALRKPLMILKEHRRELIPPVPKTEYFLGNFDISQQLKCPSLKKEYLESVYYCVFQNLIAYSNPLDPFIHRIPRYEALQSQRISFQKLYRAQLQGQYELSDASTGSKAQLLSYISNNPEIEPHDLHRLKRDLEMEVQRQISPATWIIMATKYLKTDRLLTAPVSNYIYQLSSTESDKSSLSHERPLILDLGGQEVCDWAWHCAMEYPEAQICTVILRSQYQVSNSRLSGPRNHERVLVEKLQQLPFQDNHFDLISARNLYTILKSKHESGKDEWDACLKECFRILKPGGYLEFDLIDSNIVNAGPLGLAKSQKFGDTLESLGYDPYPTENWHSRLCRAGFVERHLTLIYLPVGPWMKGQSESQRVVDVTIKDISADDVIDFMENASAISGLIGSWLWDRWLLKCEQEIDTGEETLEGIQNVISECSKRGAGWRYTTGWARKPLSMS